MLVRRRDRAASERSADHIINLFGGVCFFAHPDHSVGRVRKVRQDGT